MNGLDPVLVIEQARREVPTGRGRPPQMALRRATSTAYYAVFHQLSRHATQYLLQDRGWTPSHAAVARWVTHLGLRDLAEALVLVGVPGKSKAIHVVFSPPVTQELTDVAEALIDLQNARHLADYDSTYIPTKALTTAHIALASDAIKKVNELWDTQDVSYQRFLGLVFGGMKVAKNR